MIPAAVLLAVLPGHPALLAERCLARLVGPRYAGRERAGRELEKLGRFALPSLRRGEPHPDLEVAERWQRLWPLAEAEAEAVRQRVAVLFDGRARPIPAEVPPARHSRAATGDTREARNLYADVYVAHHLFLEQVHLAVRPPAAGGQR